MKKYFPILLLLLLISCADKGSEVERETGAAIVFMGEFDPISRATATAFEAGDQLGVYLVNENQQFSAADNRVNNVCFEVGDDGLSTSSPALYYPDDKTAVTFHAYYPYQATIANATKLEFSVQSDQTTAENIKKSDLCYAHQSVTPSEDAQTLQFAHSMAKVITNITTGGNVATIESVRFVNTVVDFTMDLSHGAIALSKTPKTIQINTTSGNETIIPPQTFAANTKMLEINVKLAEGDKQETYYFTPLTPLTFESSKVTTINLTLNDNKTITLDGTPQIVAWTKGTAESEIKRSVNNKLTTHWVIADGRYAQVNKITLTVTDQTSNVTHSDQPTTNLAIVQGSAQAAATYTYDFAPNTLIRYPYTILSVKFYNGATLIEEAATVKATNIYKDGGQAFGVDKSALLSLSAYSASVGAQVTSAAFALTSNVPYASSYTTGGSSVQGTGATPPYSALPVTFSFPAQGAAPAAVKTHTMTITPSLNPGNSQKRTFTVTQAAVAPVLTIAPTAPGVTVPKAGASYTTNVTSNTTWSAVGTNATVTASGSGNSANFSIKIPAQPGVAQARNVKVAFATTVNAGHAVVSQTWQGTQEAVLPTLAISSAAPGVTVPVAGATYTTNVTSNTTWSAAGTNATVTTSGNGNVANFSIKIPAVTAPAVARTVKVVFATTTNAGHAAVSKTWQGTQAALAPTLTISSSAPGVTVPKAGATYYTNITSNTTWSAVGTNATVTTSGSGDVTSFVITIPATAETATRTVSVVFTTTGNGGQTAVSRTWSGTQEAARKVNPPAASDYVKIGNLNWTKGSLIAVGSDGAKVGTSTDAGLFFQFGSLVGWNPSTTATVAIAVRPAGYTGGTAWTTVGYYKDGTSGTIPTTDSPATGIGDPCRYYLGGKWRTPTTAEYKTLFNNAANGSSWATAGGSWQASPAGGNIKGLFFPAAGYRRLSDGSLLVVGSYGLYWSASVNDASLGYYLDFNSSVARPQNNSLRTNGIPVRCVSAP